MHEVLRSFLRTMQERHLAEPGAPLLLMVSGGSDSTALLYAAATLRDAGELGPVAALHVNHLLRGDDARADAQFVAAAAELVGVPLFTCDINVGALADAEGGNVEAVARRERYAAAEDALSSMCLHEGVPLSEGRIVTAHTQDDRVENFYMRSIVGTGPGGFRSMKYRNGAVIRPLLDCSREQLRAYIQERADEGLPVQRDEAGALWRTDATNEHTDRFRAYVRHEMVPVAMARNGRLLDTLCRSMNLIADEDDYLEHRAEQLVEKCSELIAAGGSNAYVLAPEFGKAPLVLQRRAVLYILQQMLGTDARVETASVHAVLDAWDEGQPISGYTANVQGNLAISANKRGVRIEPMATYRARRKGATE